MWCLMKWDNWPGFWFQKSMLLGLEFFCFAQVFLDDVNIFLALAKSDISALYSVWPAKFNQSSQWPCRLSVIYWLIARKRCWTRDSATRLLMKILCHKLRGGAVKALAESKPVKGLSVGWAGCVSRHWVGDFRNFETGGNKKKYSAAAYRGWRENSWNGTSSQVLAKLRISWDAK